MIGFSFNKTLQSTAYFLNRKPGARDNYTRVLKLLYIADRTSLAQRAAPISGDTPYAMPRGPVFSRTLNQGSQFSEELKNAPKLVLIRQGILS